jgi:hypothetical protein
MNTKLTLSLESDIIASAKYYAKKQGTSLSKLVEEFFEKISSQNESKPSITSSLIGSARSTDSDLSYKELRAKYRSES